MNTLIEQIKKIIKKIKLSKINFLNHKFKKYIIAYEEKADKIKIINSNGNYKIVDNTIPNKVKVMEIIKEHEVEIEKKINYYNNKKDDYKIVILSSGFILIALGCLFVISFFFGSYMLLFASLISFSIILYLFGLNFYKIFLFREEVRRLKLIRENKFVSDDNELKELVFDTFTIIKNKFYELVLKIISIIDNIKVKFN